MKVTCQCCKGKGYHEEKIKNLGTLDWRIAIVPCMTPGCERGIVDTDKQYQILWGKNYC